LGQTPPPPRADTLLGNAFTAIADQARVDDMTVTVTVTMTGPWSHFPLFLFGRPGHVASPTWLDAVADGSAIATEPVGTELFGFAEQAYNIWMDRAQWGDR
jgi:hypothetical protein